MKLTDFLENIIYNEAESVKLHIQHLEELILSGSVDTVIDVLNQIVKGSVKPTLKVDGFPAVIFGIDPQTKTFAIGTKRILTRPAHSIQEIDEIYSDNPELAALFKGLFPLLSQGKNLNSMYSGDLMWSPRNTIKATEEFLEFQPNTIRYQVPIDSELAREMKGCEYGIILHTKMTGPTIKQMSKTGDVNVSDFKGIRNLWVGDANLKSYTSSDADLSMFTQEINELKNLEETIDDLGFNKGKLYSFFVKVNKENYTTEEKVSMLKDYFLSEYKSPRQIDKFLDIYNNHQDKIYKFIKLNDKIIEVKDKIIDKINSTSLLKTSHSTGNGTYEDNSGEGFVAIHNGNFIKLVNRKEFSKMNAARHGEE